MSGSKKITSMSEAHTLKQAAEFWDIHRLADYWDETRQVEFTIGAQRRRRVTLAPEVYSHIEARPARVAACRRH